MLSIARSWVKRASLIAGTLLVVVLGWRIVDAIRSPSLPPWLTEVPPEPDAESIDGFAWNEWIAAESAAFEDVQQRVVSRLSVADLAIMKRFAPDLSVDQIQLLEWNHSKVLMPEGVPRGAAVLLHGLTDSPYSLRHVANHYVSRGYVAVAIRLPGHGTVPSALTKVRWESWMAATRLAVRHARALSGPDTPLHVVGYSNGAALAMKYALDSLEDEQLPRADRLVFISPMIGITSMARFAGVLGWPAAFPAFAKSAWLDIVPEYNPFKYNSFAVNAARQSSQLTRVVQKQILSAQESKRLAGLPPILTFQSVLDSTVDVQALVTTLYAKLPSNGSELVIFDCGSNPFMRPGACSVLDDLLPVSDRNYQYSVVRSGVEERFPGIGRRARYDRPIAQSYPKGVYSLSHVALPFPQDDEVYGLEGIGGLALRGERDALTVNPAVFLRMTWNPFFPLMLERIDATLPATSSPP